MGNKPSYLTIDGQKMRLVEACRRYNISTHVVIQRLNAGWDVKRALTHKVRRYRKAKRK